MTKKNKWFPSTKTEENNLLWSAGKYARIVEQRVEGQLHVEVALDDRLFYWKTSFTTDELSKKNLDSKKWK
jgi:hypothetical protein